MATIVYDHNGGGGNLFAGKKFFFTQRVPTRQTWIDLVKANGGEVVKLDTKADIVIADHARRDSPAGSISWKYIEESVKDAELKDTEKYPAGAPAHIPRQIGSGQSTRKGRVPFTAEDDRILAKWVADAERAGLALKGNALYQQLEAKNNRHTAQSWRDHYVKHEYRLRNIRTEPNNDSPGSPPTRPGRAPIIEAKAEAGSVAKVDLPIPAAARPRPYVAKSVGGTTFTKEEIDLLIGMADDIKNIDEDQAISAWEAWAAEHPNHTAQEWRNCFSKKVLLRIPKKASNQTGEVSSYSGPDQTIMPGSKSSEKKSYQPEPDSNLQASVDEIPKSQLAVEDIGQPLLDEETFMAELTSFTDEGGQIVDFNPVICGKPILLFKLWHIVNLDKFGGFNQATEKGLWPQIASHLNFHDSRTSTAPQDLESCYRDVLAAFDEAQENLAAFDEAQEDLAAGGGSESEDNAMIEAQLKLAENPSEGHVEEEPESESPSPVGALHTPLSVRRPQTPTSSNKRRVSNNYSNQEPHSYSQSSSKRQRIDKGKGKEREIPSTPEEAINKAQLPYSTRNLSKPKFASSEEPEDGREPALLSRSSKEHTTSAARQRLEPETQDFHYPSQQHGEIESALSESSSRARKAQNESKAPTGRVGISGGPSTQSQTASKRNSDLKSFIDRYISLGYPQNIVIQALQATTMHTGDAGMVMEELHNGHGIPENVQGVWTSTDDAALDDDSHPRFKEVVEKHGEERVGLRRGFLAAQRAARNQLGRAQ